MIQRVQTLWMLLTTALVVCGALLGGGTLALWLTVILGIAALVPLVAIFCYKNRPRQLSLLTAEFVLLVGCAGFAIWYAWFAHSAWAYLPMCVFAALVANYLSVHGVMRDEKLVREANRIR